MYSGGWPGRDVQLTVGLQDIERGLSKRIVGGGIAYDVELHCEIGRQVSW